MASFYCTFIYYPHSAVYLLLYQDEWQRDVILINGILTKSTNLPKSKHLIFFFHSTNITANKHLTDSVNSRKKHKLVSRVLLMSTDLLQMPCFKFPVKCHGLLLSHSSWLFHSPKTFGKCQPNELFSKYCCVIDNHPLQLHS